jgi:uncharacterized protein (TIGR00661 family)
LKQKILVAPLNWGMGHATRCIPIIKALQNCGFEPIIGSDGVALDLLKHEFPNLTFIEFPSYNISYSKKAKYFKWAILKRTPKMLKAIKGEKKFTAQLIDNFKIEGVISDNRLGVYSKLVPSVFITHQINVLSGSTTKISSKLHQQIIKKFDQCWVPDQQKEPNLSGILGHLNYNNPAVKYIGPLSRFEKIETEQDIDILALISGPEPQRTLLQEHLISQLRHLNKTIVMVCGVVENEQTVTIIGNMTIYNFMTSRQLENMLNRSQLIISRSGYTTIMDLAKLGKKAFFIPTPGQFEQEYLAKKLHKDGLVPYCEQDAFEIEKLDIVNEFKGLSSFDFEINYKSLFSLFKGE